MLYIFNQNEQLQAVLKPDTTPTYSRVTGEAYFIQPQNSTPDGAPPSPSTACPYFDAVHYEKLNGENTFTFSVPADHSDSQYVTEGNLVAFKDLDLDWQLFEIKRIVDLHGDGLIKTVFCEHAYYELLDDFIEDIRPYDVSAQFALTQALAGTRWQPGDVADLGINSTNYYYESVLSAIQKVADTWKGELQFRVVVEGGVISARYVDLLARRGADTGKQFVYSKDIKSIEREVDLTNVATALYGRGKGVEVGEGYGRRLDFADVVWSTASGDPVDKPAGQEWVGDPEALARWGRPGGRHRFGVFEDPEETDPAKLLQKTWEALQKENNPRITYRLDVADLERLSGYGHEKVRLGDTVRCIDRKFNPPLLVEARVIEINRDLLQPENTHIVLGNFAPTITDENLKVQETVKVVRDRQGVWDTATPFTGPVPTSWLDGIINTLQNEVRAGNGSVTLTDDNGILIADNPDNPTKALRLLGGLLAISNEKDPVTGEWVWRTFGTGDGFTADLLNAGQIRTSLVQILGNTYFYWDGDYLYIVNPDDGNQQIRLSKEGIRFTRDGGQTWQVAMDFDGIRMEGQSQDGHTHYTGDGTKVYDEAGNLVGHFGSFETLGDQIATFTRASTAYLSNGTQVAAGQPRFEGGGVMIEEGTSNLVKTNAGADPLFNSATGWTFFGQGASIANGVLTLKSTDGTTVSGCQCTLTNLAQNTKHSFLIRARYKDGSGNAGTLYVDLYGGITYDRAEQKLGISPSMLTNAFQDFKKDGFDSQDVPSSVQLRIFTFSTRPTEVEFVQLEQKAYATTVMDGSRATEVLTVPTAGVFQKGNWTVKLRYTPTSATNVGNVTKYLWHCYIDANNAYRLHVGWDGEFGLWVNANGTWYQVNGGSTTVGNTYFITASGDGSKLRLFVNGVQIGSDIAYVEPVGTLPANMYIGSDTYGTQQANGLLSDFAVMSRAQTLAEHQAEYQSGLPLTVDDDTTLLMTMDGTLLPTVRDFGLFTKNGRFILQDPKSGQGIELWQGSEQKVLIGRLPDGTIGQIIRGGKLYGSTIRSGPEGATSYIELASGWEPLTVVENGKTALDIWSYGGGRIQFYDTAANEMFGQISAVNDYFGEQLQIIGRSNSGVDKNVVVAGKDIIIDADNYVDIYSGSSPYRTTVHGSFHATGTLTAGDKRCTEKTSQGVVGLHTRESPEVRYIDEGRSELHSSQCIIELDPIFLECVEPDTDQTPWHIHLTPMGPFTPYVVEVCSVEGYIAIASKEPGVNGKCTWSLSAVRKGKAGDRFPRMEWLVGGDEEHDPVLTTNWEDELLSGVD